MLPDDDNDGDSDFSEDDDEFDEFDEFDWLEDLNATVTLTPPTTVPGAALKATIASCSAKFIRRGQMRESFWLSMEEPTAETSDLAFTLFDRYGCLNRQCYEHEFKKGTGVWGKELDYGDILFFERIKVDKDW
jgi:hypothetical protein